MSSVIQISAKNLGAVALPTFCPRCLWSKFHMNKLPWQMFPGIFSSIDSYNKRLVHAWFDDHNVVPPWLASLGEVVAYHKASFHYSRFQVLVKAHNIRLTGSPDDVLILRCGRAWSGLSRWCSGAVDGEGAPRPHGLIRTTWTDGPTDGLGTMVGAWWCAKNAGTTSMARMPLMQETNKYNEVDCKVMMEFGRLLRRDH